jgi:V/A-type H+-transporting ATPase subunit I
MTKYSFILLNGEQIDLLEKLQEIGLVDVTRSTKPIDDTSQKLAGEVDLLNGLIQGLNNAVIPEGVTPEYIDGDIVRLAGGQIMRYSEDSVEIKVLEREVHHLKAWGKFDKAVLDELAEAGVHLHFHVVPKKQYKPEWEQQYALSVISIGKNTVRFVVVGDDPLPGEVPAPECSVEEKQKELAEKEKHFQKTLGRIASAKDRIPELEGLRVKALEKLDLYLAGVTANTAAEETIVTLVGYAPTEKEEEVTKALDQIGVLYLKEEAQVQDNPPISFTNNWFVRQFEVLTDMYGRPAYDGFDPTPFISIFFLLFFALCMGDAGYGLILIGAGLLLKKVPSFKDMAPLVVILGAGTVIVGFFLHTFFSIDIAQWKVFEPIKGIFLPDEIAGYAGGMVLAIIVGIVHLCLAMLVKAIQAVKVKGFYASLGTLGWTLLIVGGVVVGALALAGVLDATLTKWIVIVLGIVSAIGIFPLNNPDRNKFANVGLGLWDTYNTVTGLLGDVLSYLRLYALGLAGSMLGMAFNDMGKMVLGDGSNPAFWLFFILLVVIGHTLNIAMCALGAFVHPLRLNFLEFFKNSGYEAAGRSYNPLKKQ